MCAGRSERNIFAIMGDIEMEVGAYPSNGGDPDEHDRLLAALLQLILRTIRK